MSATSIAASIVVTAIAVLLRPSGAAALNDHWQPPDIDPVATPLASVLGRIDAGRGPAAAQYVEHLRLVAGDRTLPATVIVRGADVRYATTIDGAVYGAGQNGGVRWRATPAGLVRTLGSDLQGDPLDRWPVSLLPLEASDCSLIGQTRGPRPEWVVQNAPPLGAEHWLYVDQTSGAIEREISREGSATYTIAFGDVHDAGGARRPFHWHITGFGGPADVEVERFEPRRVSAAEVAPPHSVIPPGATELVRLPAMFANNTIAVSVRVNGHPQAFILDTGTTQILVSAATALRDGVATVLNHGRAANLEAGTLDLHDVPLMTVPDIFGLDGILGYDFFAGSVVHVDFARRVVEVGPRASFTPPDGARELACSFDEGIPLCSATIGAFAGARFALDTGSSDLLFPRYLWESRDLRQQTIGFEAIAGARPRTDHFLEGPVVTVASLAPDLLFAGARFTTVRALVERTNAGTTIDIPFDGILGTDVLAHFEWWFDYSGGRTWVKMAG